MVRAPWTGGVKGLLGSSALPVTAWQGQVQQAVAYRNHPLLRACYALPPVSSHCRSASCALKNQTFQVVGIVALFLQCDEHYAELNAEKERKEKTKTTSFGVNSLRSQALYRAACR